MYFSHTKSMVKKLKHNRNILKQQEVAKKWLKLK